MPTSHSTLTKSRYVRKQNGLVHLLPSAVSGLGDIVLDDTRLQELIPNDRTREEVIRREVQRGTVIPIIDKGYRYFAEPVRSVKLGRPVKSMNSMLQEIMVELNRVLHPEKAKKLEA